MVGGNITILQDKGTMDSLLMMKFKDMVDIISCQEQSIRAIGAVA